MAASSEKEKKLQLSAELRAMYYTKGIYLPEITGLTGFSLADSRAKEEWAQRYGESKKLAFFIPLQVLWSGQERSEPCDDDPCNRNDVGEGNELLSRRT